MEKLPESHSQDFNNNLITHLETLIKEQDKKEILSKKIINHVGAFIIVYNNGEYQLMIRDKSNNTFDSFGGYNAPQSLPYMINALRLELFDEGNIVITKNNLIHSSPLIIRQLSFPIHVAVSGVRISKSQVV